MSFRLEYRRRADGQEREGGQSNEFVFEIVEFGVSVKHLSGDVQ